MKENKKLPLLLVLTTTAVFICILIGTFIGRITAPYTVGMHPPKQNDAQIPSYTLPYQTNQTGKINVNLATEEELTMLPGIGKETAKRIIEYRTKYGIFDSLDELTKVKGIGEKAVEKLRPYATVGG